MGRYFNELCDFSEVRERGSMDSTCMQINSPGSRGGGVEEGTWLEGCRVYADLTSGPLPLE